MTGTPRTRPPARSAGWWPPPWWRPGRCRPPLAPERGAGLRRRHPRAQPVHPRGAQASCPTRCRGPTSSFNLGRMGLLVAGLGDLDALVPEATDDRVHQPARTALFPEAPQHPGGPGRGRGAGGQLVRRRAFPDRHGPDGMQPRRSSPGPRPRWPPRACRAGPWCCGWTAAASSTGTRPPSASKRRRAERAGQRADVALQGW